MTELKFVKGTCYDTQDKLRFLAFKDITLFGMGLTNRRLWYGHTGTAPVPDLRGAGYVDEKTGSLVFEEKAFGREIYEKDQNIPGSQAILAKDLAGRFMLLAIQNLGRPEGNPLAELARLLNWAMKT